jgi:hypothetical protein
MTHKTVKYSCTSLHVEYIKSTTMKNHKPIGKNLIKIRPLVSLCCTVKDLIHVSCVNDFAEVKLNQRFEYT